MKLFKSKKALAIGLAGALTLGLSGVAYSYWTSTGTGSGSASTTAGNNNLSYTQNTVLNAMYPGDSAQNFTVTVKNTDLAGGQNEYVGNVGVYITTNKAGCTGADFLVNNVAAPSASPGAALHLTPTDLAPQASLTTGPDTIQFNNTGSDQSACKSATVTLHYETL